ncbi:MAG: alpha/beta hydrolase [Chloroflexota bacterium]|nr:alpha/beta hydrolase [Chloroflexota bacterium]
MLINNHDLYIETDGPTDAPAVVLLHHGLGSTRAWQAQVPALVEAGYRVVVYDRWGYGRSDPRPNLDAPTFDTDIADFRSVLDKLNLQRAALIGHSDGGTIALYIASQFPQLVVALVTVAAHIYLERATMEPGIQSIMQTYEQSPRFRKGLRRSHGEKTDDLIRSWHRDWHTAEALSWDMRPQLAKITCPTLVIQGEEDEHASSQHAIDIAENISGAELWLVPDGNHMIPQDSPKAFNRRLLQFLQDL